MFLIGTLLVIFYALDSGTIARKGSHRADRTPDSPTVGFEGKINFLLLAVWSVWFF